ncbi:hypothetical protein M3Y94_00104100 [Aphelenchoides besseyi]|nr:hypothetical protein M3Y94_00104100 [Aphelenchoides besseyi]KAI6237562.1 hypothetical protein M3Y95_00278300 [Aphelenchoides besseyi]
MTTSKKKKDTEAKKKKKQSKAKTPEKSKEKRKKKNRKTSKNHGIVPPHKEHQPVPIVNPEIVQKKPLIVHDAGMKSPEIKPLKVKSVNLPRPKVQQEELPEKKVDKKSEKKKRHRSTSKSTSKTTSKHKKPEGKAKSKSDRKSSKKKVVVRKKSTPTPKKLKSKESAKSTPKDKKQSEERRAKKRPITSDDLKLNIDEVLRIGSVLERYGVDAQRRQAFQWLADHRSDIYEDTDETAHKLLIAVGDIPMSRELAMAAIRFLVDAKLVTEEEYKNHFSIIERSPPDQHITVAQLSHLLVVSASYYKQED